MQQNKQIQELVLELARENFAERKETEDRFYQLLNELKHDREEQTRKWDEQNRKWDEAKQEFQQMHEVINVNEYDDEGTVFGRPDQVELDVIIKNGLLIIYEFKSSVSKSDMYTFERKVRFYENRPQRQANRMLVISPMIDARAQPVAQQLGIEVYSDSVVEVKSLLGIDWLSEDSL